MFKLNYFIILTIYRIKYEILFHESLTTSLQTASKHAATVCKYCEYFQINKLINVQLHLYFVVKNHDFQVTSWSTPCLTVLANKSSRMHHTSEFDCSSLCSFSCDDLVFSSNFPCTEHPPVKDLSVPKTGILKIGYLEVLWLYSNTGLQSAV